MRINKWLKTMTIALGLSLAALPAYAEDMIPPKELNPDWNPSTEFPSPTLPETSINFQTGDTAASSWSIGVINQWINKSSMSLSNDLKFTGSSNIGGETLKTEETTVTNTTGTTDEGGSSSSESSSSGSTSGGGASSGDSSGGSSSSGGTLTETVTETKPDGTVTETKADGTVTTVIETKADGAVGETVKETKAEVDVPVTTGSTVKGSESAGTVSATVLTVEGSESAGNVQEIKIVGAVDLEAGESLTVNVDKNSKDKLKVLAVDSKTGEYVLTNENTAADKKAGKSLTVKQEQEKESYTVTIPIKNIKDIKDISSKVEAINVTVNNNNSKDSKTKVTGDNYSKKTKITKNISAYDIKTNKDSSLAGTKQEQKETPILVQKVAPGVLLLTPVNLGNSNNGREGASKEVPVVKKLKNVLPQKEKIESPSEASTQEFGKKAVIDYTEKKPEGKGTPEEGVKTITVELPNEKTKKIKVTTPVKEKQVENSAP